jgi:thioredoxin 1
MSKEILFFSSPWCGPCRQMKKMLNESIQAEMNMKIIDISIDMDKATQYQVMNVPTFVVLEDGKEVSRKIGAITIDALKQM